MKKTNKKNKMKTIKIITIILAIILISIISFFGIYTQNKNKVSNSVKDYQYAMDINGARTIKLKVNTDTKEVIKDKDGKTIDSATDEEIEKNGYTKENVPNNSEDILNTENYKKVKKVIEKRLKKLNIQEYNIAVNENNGEITIEIPEDTTTDTVVSNLTTIGKFEIIDNDTNEVLLNNDNIKSSDVLYNTTSSGTTIYLEIAFNKEGKEKLEEISKTYVKQENNTTANTTGDTNVTNESTNGTTNNTTNNTTETSGTQKQITMKIDNETIMTTSFDEPITTGKIQLSVGKASTSSETIQQYATQAKNIATVLDSGNLVIKYDIEKNQYILSDIEKEDLVKIEIAVAIVILVGIIALIIKYRVRGIFAGIAYVGLTAIYMLLVRYTNVIISLESIFGIITVLLLNYLFTHILLENINKTEKEDIENIINKSTVKTYKQFFMKIVPICIMVIAFCFIKWIPISSFGMIAFWGILLIAAYNAVVTRILLKIKTEEK